MSYTGCFENIIGLSRTPCPCTADDIPSDADVSASGLYLDETPHLNLQQVQSSMDSCHELWTMMDRARSTAIADMQSDALACIRAGAQVSRKPNTSIIGEWEDSKKKLTPSTTYVGMMVKAAQIRGGTMTLKRIGLKVDTTGPITVDVYGLEGLIQSYVVNAVADTLTWYTLPAALELSMDPDGSINQRYWLLWQPGAVKPYNTRLHCNCAGGGWKPYYDEEHPYYHGEHSKNYRWAEWVLATGVKGDNLDTREDWQKTNDLHGLVAEFSFACDMNTTLCSDDLDYTDPVYRNMAQAVQYKAAYLLLTFVQSSTNPTAFTLLQGGNIEAYTEEYQSRYVKHVEYVCEEFRKPENINLNGDCLACKDEWGMEVKTIRP